MTINNLFVTYDDNGDKHFHINDEEVSEDVWTQQHPHLKRGNGSGGNQNSGLVGVGGEQVGATADDHAEEQVRQGIRDERAKAKLAGRAGDGVGRSEGGSEQA